MNEIILYQADELPERIEVREGEETVWLNHQQLASLFGRDVKTNEIDFQIKSAELPAQGIFFDGQIFDAYEFVSKLIRSNYKLNLEYGE